MKIQNKVLVLCTGGTISMLHKDESDHSSPLVPANWERIKKHFPAMDELSIDVNMKEMELIDSSNMNPSYWVKISKQIRDAYDLYDGFVILHGTDTMSYTASALSFLLENLDKPVIITGSQIPLARARNDASQNLVTALMIAASDRIPVVPEVCVLFNNTLFRGNRSRKVSSNGFAGFDSPNFPPLGEIGEYIRINRNLLRKASTKGFFINELLDSNVIIFDIFPGISPHILRNVFEIQGLKGVILRTYGAGNMSTSDDLINEIEQAITKGIAVVNITQCVQGMVEMGMYDASVKLARIGVISGADLTPEAALVKMMFLLGQGYDIATVKDQIQKDMRGEQSVNVFNFIYGDGTTDSNCFRLKTQHITAGFIRENITKATIQFDTVGINNVEDEGKPLNLAIFMNYPSANIDTPLDIPQCLGVIENFNNDTDFMLECTKKTSRVIAPERPLQLNIVVQNGNISWDGMVFSIYTQVTD